MRLSTVMVYKTTSFPIDTETKRVKFSRNRSNHNRQLIVRFVLRIELIVFWSYVILSRRIHESWNSLREIQLIINYSYWFANHGFSQTQYCRTTFCAEFSAYFRVLNIFSFNRDNLIRTRIHTYDNQFILSILYLRAYV